MFLYLDCVPSPSESMWFSYAAIASATDLTRGAFGSSMAASFRIARCQSRVFNDCRWRLPFNSPSHQIGQEHFVSFCPLFPLGNKKPKTKHKQP